MNPGSARARNQNLLNQKTKAFKHLQRIIRESKVAFESTWTCRKLYSKSSNKNFNPETMNNSKVSRMSSSRSSRGKSASLSQSKNMNDTMSGLSMRVEHVSTFAELNTQLLHEKKQLQSLILMLKQGIAKEKKKLNTAEYNASHSTNQITNFAAAYQEAHRKSLRLNEDIRLVNEEISELEKNLGSLDKKIKKKKQKIGEERKNIKTVNKQAKQLKKSLMEEQKLRAYFKSELIKQQKVMQSSSIHLKQLENEKALLLLEINESVSLNKL